MQLRPFRAFAWCYLAVSIAAILWFVFVQAGNLPGEHMMPMFLLGFVGMPMALAAMAVIQMAPESVGTSGWFQDSLLCASPLLQAWLLFWLSRLRVKK
jgi:hypothetical protein